MTNGKRAVEEEKERDVCLPRCRCHPCSGTWMTARVRARLHLCVFVCLTPSRGIWVFFCDTPLKSCVSPSPSAGHGKKKVFQRHFPSDCLNTALSSDALASSRAGVRVGHRWVGGSRRGAGRQS